jgi:hypothetical protein
MLWFVLCQLCKWGLRHAFQTRFIYMTYFSLFYIILILKMRILLWCYCVAQSLVLCLMFCRSLSVLFLFPIVLSVLIFTTYMDGYPLGIFILSIHESYCIFISYFWLNIYVCCIILHFIINLNTFYMFAFYCHVIGFVSHNRCFWLIIHYKLQCKFILNLL